MHYCQGPAEGSKESWSHAAVTTAPVQLWEGDTLPSAGDRRRGALGRVWDEAQRLWSHRSWGPEGRRAQVSVGSRRLIQDRHRRPGGGQGDLSKENRQSWGGAGGFWLVAEEDLGTEAPTG